MNDNEILGQKIRQLRIEKGITQEELAKRLGYSSRSTINKIELGKHGMHRTKIMSFAHALNTSVEYLLGMTNNPVKYETYIMAVTEDEGTYKFPMSNEDIKKVLKFIETMDGDK